MIRFDKVKRTKEKTYFFFSNHYRRDLIWGLEEAMRQLYFGRDEDLWEHKLEVSEEALVAYEARWDVFSITKLLRIMV